MRGSPLCSRAPRNAAGASLQRRRPHQPLHLLDQPGAPSPGRRRAARRDLAAHDRHRQAMGVRALCVRLRTASLSVLRTRLFACVPTSSMLHVTPSFAQLVRAVPDHLQRPDRRRPGLRYTTLPSNDGPAHHRGRCAGWGWLAYNKNTCLLNIVSMPNQVRGGRALRRTVLRRWLGAHRTP
jgi:hypothetical protein